MNNIKEIYKNIDSILSDMKPTCSNCYNCCKSYSWLLRDEVKIFSKLAIPLIRINNKVFCIDSFKRNNKNEIVLDDKIPECRFYKNKKCSIYSNRPFFCRFYPILFRSKGEKIIFVLDKNCFYVKFLNKNDIKNIRDGFDAFLSNINRKFIIKIISDLYEVSKITTIISKNDIKIKEIDISELMRKGK